MIPRPYILYPEWLGSDRVVALRDHVKLFFIKIGNVTDGAGRFEADPALLRAALYPKELHKVSERDVKGMLEQIHIAGLVRLYTRADKGFGEVTIYKQKDAMRKVRYPGPDAGELNFAGAPPGSREPDADEFSVFKPNRSEANKNELCELAPPAHTPHDTVGGSLTQREWMESLSVKWPGVDMAEQLREAAEYVKKRRGPKARLSRKFFVKHWLPGCASDEVVFPESRDVCQRVDKEPQGWREVLRGTVLGDRVNEEKLGWDDLNTGQRDFVLGRVQKQPRAV